MSVVKHASPDIHGGGFRPADILAKVQTALGSRRHTSDHSAALGPSLDFRHVAPYAIPSTVVALGLVGAGAFVHFEPQIFQGLEHLGQTLGYLPNNNFKDVQIPANPENPVDITISVDPGQAYYFYANGTANEGALLSVTGYTANADGTVNPNGQVNFPDQQLTNQLPGGDGTIGIAMVLNTTGSPIFVHVTSQGNLIVGEGAIPNYNPALPNGGITTAADVETATNSLRATIEAKLDADGKPITGYGRMGVLVPEGNGTFRALALVFDETGVVSIEDAAPPAIETPTPTTPPSVVPSTK